jgi:hypothetical protein
MMSGPLVNDSSQTAAPFQFPFIVLLRHGRGAIFNLQPSSSPPRSFNFNPSRQLHPSSTAAEDSGAKYFLAMLEYRCNPADPEAMALL